jgi:hypothetical protein
VIQHKNALAGLVELDLERLAHHRHIRHSPRSFFRLVRLAHTRQGIPNGFINWYFISQATFQTAANARNA